MYELGDVNVLNTQIENRDENGRGQAFRSHRWTSRLALDRATVVAELLLETEPEWRLYEDLRASEIAFRIVADKVKLTYPDDPKGRVWFVTEDGVKVRYAGASGFLVRRIGIEDKYFVRLEEVLEILLGIGEK
jgi:hypothetical protein